jgi:hypothetical protein
MFSRLILFEAKKDMNESEIWEYDSLRKWIEEAIQYYPYYWITYNIYKLFLVANTN